MFFDNGRYFPKCIGEQTSTERIIPTHCSLPQIISIQNYKYLLAETCYSGNASHVADAHLACNLLFSNDLALDFGFWFNQSLTRPSMNARFFNALFLIDVFEVLILK